MLGRGYALVRHEPKGWIVRSASELQIGDRLEVRFGVGRVDAEVLRVEPEETSA